MIENLNLKINGQEPVTREELIELVNSWGRLEYSSTINSFGYDLEINKCEPNEKYDLSNLDVSQINDLCYIFRYSLYNGDLSKWDTSNCINMKSLFSRSKFNNDSISNWNVSNVKNMNHMFYQSIFNSNISNWNVSNVLTMEYCFTRSVFDKNLSKWNFNKDINCKDMFYLNHNFIKKYNNNEDFPTQTNDILKWFKKNREKMREINQGSREEILDFFSFDNNINIELKD